MGGICARCGFARLVQSARGSVFLLCKNPGLPKYPRQPVSTCGGFKAAEPAEPTEEAPTHVD